MYSETINAFQPAPHAVMLPVIREGTRAGKRRRFQYVLPRSPNALAASSTSAGIERTPAIRLNNKYHCMLNRAIRRAASCASSPTADAITIEGPKIAGSSGAAGREG